MWCVFCSSCLNQPFAWKWLPLPELGPPTYSNLAGFCSESIIQKQERWCISGVGQRATCTTWGRVKFPEHLPPASHSMWGCSRLIGGERWSWSNMVLIAVDGMALSLPSHSYFSIVEKRHWGLWNICWDHHAFSAPVSWILLLSGVCKYSLLCRETVGSGCPCLLAPKSLYRCLSVWEMSICCMAFLGARRKIFYLAFLVSCCQIVTRHSTLWSRLLTTSRAGAGRLTLSQMKRDFFP